MDEQTKINWGRVLSPCIIASIFLIIGIIVSIFDLGHSGGWSMLGVIVFIPFLLVFIIIDMIVKKFTTDRTVALWLIEIALISLSIIIYQYRTH